MSKSVKTIFSVLAVLLVSVAEVFAQAPVMVYVEGGSFQMGSNDGAADAKPVHTVIVDSFYMSKYKLSLYEWGMTVGEWPFNYRNIWYENPAPDDKYDKVPAYGISWYEAISFCNRLSVEEGLTPCYAADGSKDAVTYAYLRKDYMTSTTGKINGKITCDWNADGYRLPTEAEWEYAARGGKHNSPYKFSGSNKFREVANISKEYWYMGTAKPNALGLYDMASGPEWCWDLYSSKYYLESDGSKNPYGPENSDKQDVYIPNETVTRSDLRVQRGGYYYEGQPEWGSQVYYRSSDIPERWEIIVGPIEYTIRLVRNADAVETSVKTESKDPELFRAAIDVSAGSVRSLSLLIQAGADVNEENRAGATALYWAVEQYVCGSIMDSSGIRFLNSKEKKQLEKNIRALISYGASCDGVIEWLSKQEYFDPKKRTIEPVSQTHIKQAEKLVKSVQK